MLLSAHWQHRKTVELAQRAESVGCAWISVHGRTPRQKSTTAVNVEAIRLVLLLRYYCCYCC